MEMNQQTDKLDNELLNLLQSEFPISESPFLELGARLSISESEVIKRINKLKEINYIRQISAIFDVEDPIKGEYTLEVSSPGLERPLAKPAHFLRFIGSKVKVQTKTLHLGRRRFTGPLTEATEESCCIEVDGEVYELPYHDIDKANLVAFESGHSQNRAS